MKLADSFGFANMLVSFLTVFNLTMQRLLFKKKGTIRKYAKRTKRGGKRTFAEGKLLWQIGRMATILNARKSLVSKFFLALRKNVFCVFQGC